MAAGSLKVGSGKTDHRKKAMARAGLQRRTINYRFDLVPMRRSKLNRRALATIRTFLVVPAITRIGKEMAQGPVMAVALTPVLTTAAPMTDLGRVALMGMAMVGGRGRSIGRGMWWTASRADIGKCLIAARVTTFLAAIGIAHKARVTSLFNRPTVSE